MHPTTVKRMSAVFLGPIPISSAGDADGCGRLLLLLDVRITIVQFFNETFTENVLTKIYGLTLLLTCAIITNFNFST